MSTEQQAVDLEWEAKIAGLRKRKPAETFRTIHDIEKVTEASNRRREAAEARREARRRLTVGDEKPTEQQVDADEQVAAADHAAREAQDAAAEAEVVFHFRQLPPDVYDQMILAHEPTETQRAKYDMAYNPDTYIPALIAACSVRPLTSETVKSLMTADEDGNIALNQGDVAALFEACREVNERPRLTLGKGSRPTPD